MGPAGGRQSGEGLIIAYKSPSPVLPRFCLLPRKSGETSKRNPFCVLVFLSFLYAAIYEIMDSACLLSSKKSSIAEAALCVFPFLCAAIHEIMDSACLLSLMKSSIAQAALCVFPFLCVVDELPVLYVDFHDHFAESTLTYSFCKDRPRGIHPLLPTAHHDASDYR